MGRTDWGQIVFDKQLYTAKSNHKKIFVSLKILASELPEYIDAGWEKSIKALNLLAFPKRSL